jgi:hypothetical protein
MYITFMQETNREPESKEIVLIKGSVENARGNTEVCVIGQDVQAVKKAVCKSLRCLAMVK